MTQPLCTNCGKPMGNVAGPPLYCPHCGEPRPK